MGASGAKGAGGGASGSAAGGSSLATIGLQAYSTMLQAEGTATADEFQAAKLESAATYGDLKAVQTGGQMTRSLNSTLGNIAAVRAAAHADPNSPTGAAIMDEQETIGDQNRSIAVDNITAQARQQRADAAYYRQAGADALFAGEVGTAAGIAKGIASLPIAGGG